MTDAATADEATPESDDTNGGDGGYSGLLGAFRFAFRRSESLLFKCYAAFSLLLGAMLSVVLLAALAQWFTETLGQSALSTSSNAFLGVIALFVLGPLFAPVIFVARRHDRDEGDDYADHDSSTDARLALAGIGFVVSLYVGLIITVPPEYQSENAGAVASALYSLPQLWGLVPPLVGALTVFAVERLLR